MCHNIVKICLDGVKPLGNSHSVLLQEYNVIFDFFVFLMDSTICTLQEPEIIKSTIKSSADSAVIWVRVVLWALSCHLFAPIRTKTLKPLGNSHSMLLQECDVIFDFFVFLMDRAICALSIAEIFKTSSKSAANLTVQWIRVVLWTKRFPVSRCLEVRFELCKPCVYCVSDGSDISKIFSNSLSILFTTLDLGKL